MIPWWAWLIVFVTLIGLFVFWLSMPMKWRAWWHWRWFHSRKYPEFEKIYNISGGFIYPWGFEDDVECRHEDCKARNKGMALSL